MKQLITIFQLACYGICYGRRRLCLGRKVSKLHISVHLSDGSGKIKGVFSQWAVGRYPEWPEHQTTVLVVPKLKEKVNNLRTCSMSGSHGMQESTSREFFHLSRSFLEQSSCKSRNSVPTALLSGLNLPSQFPSQFSCAGRLLSPLPCHAGSRGGCWLTPHSAKWQSC